MADEPTRGLLGMLPPILQGQQVVHQIVPQLVPGSPAPGVIPGFGTTLPATAASTRFPTAVRRAADPLVTPTMSGDLPAYLASDVGKFNVGLLSTYPGMGFLKGMGTEEAATRR